MLFASRRPTGLTLTQELFAMPDYRRNRVPGGCYFFTVNLRDRRTDILVRRIDLLRACVKQARDAAPFHIDAWVTLPDHLHCIWTLPEGDDDYPSRWLRIKQRFSRGIPNTELKTAAMTGRGDRGIWQRGYWEHTIRDDVDYQRHMDYVHFNPVKHGLVIDPAAWPYSTFRRAVAAGLYAEQWKGRDKEIEGDFGE